MQELCGTGDEQEENISREKEGGKRQTTRTTNIPDVKP